MRACQLRYEGVSAGAAARQLGVSVHTFNNWFRTGGRLYEKYAHFCKELDDQYKSTAKHTIMQAVTIAAEELVDEVTSCDNPHVRHMAAKEILLRGLGKPKDDGASQIVVTLVDPVKRTDVPPGYNPDGTPITTVQDAVDASEERAGTEERRHELARLREGIKVDADSKAAYDQKL